MFLIPLSYFITLDGEKNLVFRETQLEDYWCRERRRKKRTLGRSRRGGRKEKEIHEVECGLTEENAGEEKSR